MLKGGCYCGAVRYEATAHAFHLTNCHCSICHRTSGAPFVAWLKLADHLPEFLNARNQG